MWTRIFIGLSFIIGIGVGSIIDSDIWAGLLEPPSSAVPEGTPTSTMRPLDELNGAWSQTLQCDTQEDCPRFELVMNDAAVLDKETGLVWDQAPNTTAIGTQSVQQTSCAGLLLGGRMGWRLPSVHELASLVAFGSSEGNPRLPIGHPFSGVQFEDLDAYWSATINPNAPERGLLVSFFFGSMVVDDSSDEYLRWCVRGGQNDVY